MIGWIESKILIRIDAIAGETQRNQRDVGFGVATEGGAFTQSEQLHQLAGEILIRLALFIARTVEVFAHPGIAGHGLQKVA